MNTYVNPELLEIAKQTASTPNTTRKKMFVALASGVALIGLGFGAYQVFLGSKHVTTDNAYVDTDAAQVNALTSGPVKEVRVVDTQTVRKGDILVVIDNTDRRLELEQAQSALGDIGRRVQGYQANNTALDGQIMARRADLARAAAELARAKLDYGRRLSLAGSGAISGEELSSFKTGLDAAQASYAQAEANVQGAKGSYEANNALISGLPLDQNPQVTAARFRVEQAQVALDRTVVRAPVDGVVVKRTVQVGQMVQPGTPLMTVVPVQQAYVNANFKEVQLKKVRVGQEAELTSDLYGDKVVYHGRVMGFSGGTGAALSIVPAQNATGNWIKVVQRLPVRIALDPKELAANPLRVGLSMNADIIVSR